eukprot:5857-Heterococcus_DN1.PRE.1
MCCLAAAAAAAAVQTGSQAALQQRQRQQHTRLLALRLWRETCRSGGASRRRRSAQRCLPVLLLLGCGALRSDPPGHPLAAVTAGLTSALRA